MAKGINTDFIDYTVSPEEDFYQFVNGGWLRKTEIPPDRGSWGSFHELSKETDHNVLAILAQELNTPGPSPNKAARLFETGMDIESIEKSRLMALDPFMFRIEEYEFPEQIADLLGALSESGIHALINLSVHPDLGDSKRYAAYIEPAELILPEREYYLDQDERSIEIRGKYLAYVEKLLQDEAGWSADKAAQMAIEILRFETSLANQIMTKEDRRQIEKLYNPYTYKELSDLTPEWNWRNFFNAYGQSPEKVIVTEPDYLTFMTRQLASEKAGFLKEYLKFLLIHQAASFAHASLEEAHFELFGKTLEGVEQMRPRNERMVRVINQSLGELLGQIFVSTYFPPNAKEMALEMTDDIIESFKNRIQSLPWMGESTRNYALDKLSSFKVKIGYPDKWKDFSALVITGKEDGGHYLQNILAVSKWKQHTDYQRIGKEIDPEEWYMAPQVVNAYYNPMNNEIVFPAAILQPPFFNWHADAAVNYGGIGAVIGHEITHGFDDQGSRFDKDGNLNEWWTQEDKEKFRNLTDKLVQQFDAYQPFDDLSLNGTFTLGENIADLGGLSVAYDALQLHFKKHGVPDPIDGFSAEQRFFMSWATIWRTKIRPEALRNQIKTDPHPPGHYRAIAAPSNLQPFYDAFKVVPRSKWYREEKERIKIW